MPSMHRRGVAYGEAEGDEVCSIRIFRVNGADDPDRTELVRPGSVNHGDAEHAQARLIADACMPGILWTACGARSGNLFLPALPKLARRIRAALQTRTRREA